MRQLRVSVTDLDQFRAYLDADDMSVDDLRRRLSHKEPASEAMLMGRAFHKFLEAALMGKHHGARQDGYCFVFEGDMTVRLPRIREMRCLRAIAIGDIILSVSGIVDAVDTATIYDHKLTAHFDIDRYMDSYQWRLYLWALGMRRFIYNAFTRGDCSIDKVVPVLGCDVLPLFAYPGMDADVRNLLERYVQFAVQYQPEEIVCT